MASEPKSRSRDATQLRSIREELYERFDRLATPKDLFELQLAVVGEIKAAEEAIAAERTSPERVHRHLVRLIGDSLCWRYLHPYTIRQLHHDAGSPPNLSNQSGFDLTLEVAKQVCDRGHPALISDLTYVLGTADIVLAVDAEYPILIECGGNPRYFNRGRKKRQAERANAALTQLREGINHWPDRSIPTKTVELDLEITSVFGELESAILEARATKGCSTVHIEDEQFVFAIDDAAEPEEISFVADDFDLDGYIVSLSEIRERHRNPRVAPPHVWPLAAESRVAVIEGDVHVGHAINLSALVGLRSGESKIVGLHSHEESVWVRAEHKGEPFVLGPGILAEALGTYQSFGSTADLILGTLGQVEDVRKDQPPPARNEGPDLARRLCEEVEKQGRPQDPTFRLPPTLLSELLDGLRADQSD